MAAMRPSIVVAASVVVLIAACGRSPAPPATPVPLTPAPASTPSPSTTPVPTQTPTATPVPPTGTYEEAECAFEPPLGRVAECGYLTVPEQHGNPDGPTIRLHVAIFLSTSRRPAADPVVLLTGGPGANGPLGLDGGPDHHPIRGTAAIVQEQVAIAAPALYR